MSSYKPMDSKREEFRKYLEKTGVIDALTKALLALYEEPERPEDALSYMKAHLGTFNLEETELVQELRKEIANLKNELADLIMEMTKTLVIENDSEESLGDVENTIKVEMSPNSLNSGKPEDGLGKDHHIEKKDGVLKSEGLETGEPAATEATERLAAASADG